MRFPAYFVTGTVAFSTEVLDCAAVTPICFEVAFRGIACRAGLFLRGIVCCHHDKFLSAARATCKACLALGVGGWFLMLAGSLWGLKHNWV